MDTDHICHCETDVVVTVKLLPGRRYRWQPWCPWGCDTQSKWFLIIQCSEHDLQSFSGTFGKGTCCNTSECKTLFLDLSSILAEWGLESSSRFPCAANATFWTRCDLGLAERRTRTATWEGCSRLHAVWNSGKQARDFWGPDLFTEFEPTKCIKLW